ncbi:MAG: F0F1 ATP synthase subunit B [Bacteroidales bacterium]|jgi:F-type H+-transporting ATPase subunit b|nr:F0F1 ATP synthase subunit B [Bacteroidales bacterium]
MDLITPGFGLVFWTTVIFLILLLVLKKVAWKPIVGAIDSRNKSIADALKLAETTRAEMAQLQADNETIIQEARKERDTLLKEARDLKEQIIAQAQQEAKSEAEKITQQALQSIENEKLNAIEELRGKVAEISIEIAEKILAQELSDKKASEKFINQSIQNLKLN